MCGIFGYVGKKTDGPSKILAGLKQLEYRGYDSWGVAVASQNNTSHPQLLVEKHVGKIGDAQLAKTDVPSGLAVGHTRWATHGGVTIENAHPHLDSHHQIAVVHNGIIENYQSLKEELLEKGYSFLSQTDSEVFTLLVEENLKTLSLVEAVQKVFQRLHGLNAFVVLSLKEQQMVVVRKGSPLALGRGEDGLYVASDSSAMALYAKDVYFLEDDHLAVLDLNGARVFELNSLKPQPISWQKLEFEKEDLSKGKFPHYLLKEIHEQPRVLTDVAKNLLPQLKKYSDHLQGRPLFVGCGSAFHASLSASYLWWEVVKKQASATPGSEFRYLRETLTSDDFVTFISQSGETIDIVEHLPELKKKNVPFGAIVNRFGSSLERGSLHKVILPAGPEQAVLATKSYTAMLATLQLLAYLNADRFNEGYEQLLETADFTEKLLSAEYRQKHVVPVAKKLAEADHVFVIGRGHSYPVSLEAALKIKEVTYVHTEGFAGGELKHGVIALIEEGTPCIVFAPEGKEREASISNALELKVRGAFIIGVGSKNNEAFDLFLPVEGNEVQSTITAAVAIQLVAYEMAVLLGNDPDKPRNLAKSVTVK